MDNHISLYGCTCGQVLYYYAHYYIPGDHAHVKALVCHFHPSPSHRINGSDDRMAGCSALVTTVICFFNRCLPMLLTTSLQDSGYKQINYRLSGQCLPPTEDKSAVHSSLHIPQCGWDLLIVDHGGKFSVIEKVPR